MKNSTNNLRCQYHIYILKDISTTIGKDYLVYSCEKCSHYVPLKLAKGRKFLCAECGDVTEINPYHITEKIKRPKCGDCRRGIPKGKTEVVAGDNLSELLSQLAKK